MSRSPTLIVSPHLDDAVLGLGQYLAVRPGTTVATVFAGIPEDGLSDYDRSCGFTTSTEAMTTRRDEDTAALRTLQGRPHHLDFLDRQYGQPTDDDTLTAALAAVYRPDVLAFVPLGIGHPDHEQVARCARAALPTGTLICFEELPYRVLHPEQVVDALDKIHAEGWAIGELPYPLDQGAREHKATAVACYTSQFPNGADDPCLLVPERAWRIAR